jgi:hypothetical protein
LLRKIIEHLPKEKTFVTATTGVAAVNIGGMYVMILPVHFLNAFVF